MIGSGPAGQKAAIQAAKLGQRVAVVERRDMVGGVCINTGTIPSKTLREAVVYLTGMSQRGIYGAELPRQGGHHESTTCSARIQHVIQREIDVIRSQLAPQPRRSCSPATARFVDPHTVSVDSVTGDERRVTAAKDRDRDRHPPGPPVDASTSTGAPCSTPTASLARHGCRARWSSSAPA